MAAGAAAWEVPYVAGGVAEYLDVVMWIVVPFGPGPADTAVGQPAAAGADPVTSWNAQPHRTERRSGSGSRIFGLILIGLGLYFLAREYLPGVDFDRLWPLRLVMLGVILLYGAIRSRPA